MKVQCSCECFRTADCQIPPCKWPYNKLVYWLYGWSYPPWLLISRCFSGTSLMVWWIRIHLPMQGTWVQSLVRDDSTWRGPPMRHNYWSLHAQRLSLVSNKRSHCNEKHVHCNKSSSHSSQLDKAHKQQQRLKCNQDLKKKKKKMTCQFGGHFLFPWTFNNRDVGHANVCIC